MRFHEAQGLGAFSLQHHDKVDPTGREWTFENREVLWAARSVIERTGGENGLVERDVAPDTWGPISGGLCLPYDEGSDRKVTEWTWATAVEVESVPEEGTTTSERMKVRPVHSTFPGGWNLNTSSEGKLGPFEAQGPKDQRYAKGTPGIVVAGTDLGDQHACFIPAGTTLVAPHWNASASLGTFVYDLEPENELAKKRKARLQTLTRVRKNPKLLALYGPPNEFGGLALQIGIARDPSEKDKSTRGAVLCDSRRKLGKGPSGLATNTSEWEKTQEFGSLSRQLDGPIHLGCTKHFHDATDENENYGACEIQSNFFFHVSDFACGPLRHDGIVPDLKPPPGIPREVYFGFDDRDTHSTILGAKKGKHRWWTRVPDVFVTPPVVETPPPIIETPPPPIETPPPVIETGPPPPVEETPPPIIEEGPNIDLQPDPGRIPTGECCDVPNIDLQPDFNGIIGRDARTATGLNLGSVWSPQERAMPSLTFRPVHYQRGQPDTRNAFAFAPGTVEKLNCKTPTVARLEAVGAQSGDTWDYTTQPCAGRYGGGTTDGTIWIFPGEVGAEQVFDGTVPPTTSEFCIGIYTGGCIGFGTPVTTGGIGSGWEIYQSGNTLTIGTTTSTGATGDAALVIDSGGTLTAFGETVCTGDCGGGAVPGLYGDNHAT